MRSSNAHWIKPKFSLVFIKFKNKWFLFLQSLFFVCIWCLRSCMEGNFGARIACQWLVNSQKGFFCTIVILRVPQFTFLTHTKRIKVNSSKRMFRVTFYDHAHTYTTNQLSVVHFKCQIEICNCINVKEYRICKI